MKNELYPRIPIGGGEPVSWTISLLERSPLVWKHQQWKRLLLTEEFREWLSDSGIYPECRFDHNVITMTFHSTADAMAFRLRWL